MSIKNFGGTDEPAPPPTPRSLFDPIRPANHAPHSALGTRLYASGETEETDYDALSATLFGTGEQTERATKDSSELVVMYERMSRLPTRTNIDAFRNKIAELSTDPARVAFALAVQAAVMSSLRQSRGGQA